MKLNLCANATIGSAPAMRCQRLFHSAPPQVWSQYRRFACRSSDGAPSNDPTWFLLADTHIAEKTLARLDLFFNKFFFSEFEAHKPSQVLFLGDTFHIRGGTDPGHHRFFTEILERIIAAPWSPQVHLLVGNHDMKNRYNRQDNSLQPFRLVSGRIHVYSETTPQLLDDFPTVFIPFHSDDKSVREYVTNSASADTVAFYHGPINGAMMNSHKTCDTAEVSPSNLAKYKHVFLGHFHTHGPVGGPGSKTVYVGSPIQSNMGDAGDLARGLVIYRPRWNTWKLHANPYAEHFIKVSLNDVWDIDGSLVAGKKVRLMVDADVPATKVTKAREVLYAFEADMVETSSDGVKMAPGSDSSVQTAQTEPAAVVTLGHTIRDMVVSFMETRGSQVSSEDQQKLEDQRKEFFLDFMKPFQQHSPQSKTTGSVFQGDLVSIEMKNFRGLKGTTVINLDALPASEVFLVSGANGSGKSTLIESIVWCLFGEFIAGKRDAIPVDEISFNNAPDCSVRLKFRNGYQFERSRRGKGKVKKVAFEIYGPDGRLQEHGHDAATNTAYLIQHIMHMDLSMFKQTVVIGDNAEYFVRSAGDKGRTECLDAMFGLDILGQMREEISVMLKERQTLVTKYKGLEQEYAYKIAENTRQWESRKAELRNEEQREKRLQVEAANSRAELEQLRPKRRELDSVIAEKQALLDAVDEEKHSVSQVLQNWSNKHREFTAAARQHDRVRADVEEFFRRQRMAEIAAERAARKAREAREAEERKNKEPMQILLSWTSTIWENIRRIAFGLPQEVAKVEVEDKVEEKAQPLPAAEPPFYDRHLHEYIQQKIDAVAGMMSQQQHLLQTLLNRERSLSQALRIPADQAKRLDQALSSLERRISSAEGQLKLIKSQRKDHLKRLQNCSKLDISLRSTLSQVQTTLAEHEHQYELGSFWKSQLQDSERTKGAFLTHCRSAYVSHINILIPSILHELCADSEQLLSTQQLLSFELTADFRLLPAPGALSLARRSRGQLTRTYLTLFLAMFVTARARMPFRPSFLFMDEIIDALDEAGMEGLRSWLAAYLRREGGRAFLLTHREVAGGRVIQVVKKRGGETEYRLKT